MRFPVLHSIPVLCAQGLLYGVVYSAALLVFRSGSVAAVFGAVVFAAGVLVPLAGLMRIVSNVADGAAHYTLDVDTEERTFLTFFIGNGEWVSGSSNAVWLYRMSAVVRDNRVIEVPIWQRGEGGHMLYSPAKAFLLEKGRCKGGMGKGPEGA